MIARHSWKEVLTYESTVVNKSDVCSMFAMMIGLIHSYAAFFFSFCGIKTVHFILHFTFVRPSVESICEKHIVKRQLHLNQVRLCDW